MQLGKRRKEKLWNKVAPCLSRLPWGRARGLILIEGDKIKSGPGMWEPGGPVPWCQGHHHHLMPIM